MALAPEVFISYSTPDTAVAEAARAALEGQGIGCWIAPRDIGPGQDWSEAIVDALELCPVVLLIVSTHSNDSEQVKREVENAVSLRRTIIPFRIDSVALSKQMRYFIGTPHWLTAIEPPLEAHLPRLIEAVQRILAKKHDAVATQNTTQKPAEVSLNALPTGLVTLVFTDIQGSSALWEEHGPGFSPVLNEHNRLLREAAAKYRGVEVKTEGDAFFLSFSSASDAVRFAVDAQRAIAAHNWNAVLSGLHELRVRIGMHSGTPILESHPNGTFDYFGPVVNRAARVGGAGHGAQIVVSNATWQLVQGEVPAEITGDNLGKHRLKGVGEEILWQINHPELPARFPPLATLSAIKHNLPAQATPFIGRESEISQWSEWLRAEQSRLVTLLGFGGHGKTRLALQIAEQLAEHYGDGVWWVELEEARDSEAMLARIAHELRLHLAPQPTLREQILDFHRERHLLLVLDNLEQIPDAGRVLGEILQEAPRVQLLVTTRRSLELRHERIAPVSPLPTTDASRLFEERARARQPEFQITTQNATAIEELCRRLEGVPLAIELAASRAGVLSPEEMLERLGEQFRLLQTRAPDLPPRQRALRGAIDWSYDLLHDDDKALLAHLSVFVGGFTLEAAESVNEELDVLEGVAELRRHSLLRTEEIEGKTRFSMLEAVRAYGAEKLRESADDGIPQRRHAEYFLRFFERRAQNLNAREEAKALSDFFGERANGAAALDWLIEHGDKRSAARLALALHEFLWRGGFWGEARRVVEVGLGALSSLTDAGELRPLLELALAKLALDMGDAKAGALAETALADFRSFGFTSGEASALNLMGLLAMDASDFDSARANFEQSLQLRKTDEHHGRAIALHNLALLASRLGNVDEARRFYELAITQRQAGGDVRGEAETLGNLGALAFKTGDISGAAQLYQQSLEIRRTLRDQFGIALMLFNLAEIAENQREMPRAVALYLHAQRLFHELGSPYESAPAEALARLESELSDYLALRPSSENTAWEEWV